MKMVIHPPSWTETLNNFAEKKKFQQIMTAVSGPAVLGKYLHWQDLRHRTPPKGLTHEEWWAGLKLRRKSDSKEIPLKDNNSEPFQYLSTDPIPEHLHKIDKGAAGVIRMPEQITNPDTRDQYCVSSLIEEAITSSQLEGATTTRKVAKEMLRTKRPRINKTRINFTTQTN
jgi:hypothetical protein